MEDSSSEHGRTSVWSGDEVQAEPDSRAAAGVSAGGGTTAEGGTSPELEWPPHLPQHSAEMCYIRC